MTPFAQIITPEMEQIKELIIETVAKRNSLKSQMEAWYKANPKERFPAMNELITVDASLSELDLRYKLLWDNHNTKSSFAS